jgi:hypothetical protein
MRIYECYANAANDKEFNYYGENSINCKSKKKTKVFNAHRKALLALWPQSWLYARFWAMPHLF